MAVGAEFLGARVAPGAEVFGARRWLPKLGHTNVPDSGAVVSGELGGS